MAAGFNREESCRQIGLELEQSSARDAEPRGKSLEKDAMIYGVECSRVVEKTQAGNLQMADGRDQFVIYR